MSNVSPLSGSRRRIGALMLLVSLIFLGAQFWLAFSTSVLPTDTSPSTLALHLAPYSLLLIALYLLFNNRAVSSRLMHVVMVLMASWGAAGGFFLVAMLVSFVAAGVAGIERVFALMPIALIVGSALFFPLIYPRLRF